jgi:hypothetical protein
VGRKFKSINVIIRRRMEFVTFRHVSTHPDFVRRTVGLQLNVDNEQRGLERSFHDLLHLCLREWPKHSSGNHFFLKVSSDFVVVIGARRVIQEDDAFGKNWEFTHGKSIAEIAGKERVRGCEVMFLQESIKGVRVVRRLDV